MDPGPPAWSAEDDSVVCPLCCGTGRYCFKAAVSQAAVSASSAGGDTGEVVLGGSEPWRDPAWRSRSAEAAVYGCARTDDEWKGWRALLQEEWRFTWLRWLSKAAAPQSRRPQAPACYASTLLPFLPSLSTMIKRSNSHLHQRRSSDLHHHRRRSSEPGHSVHLCLDP